MDNKLKKYQDHLMEMLIEFQCFCDEHNIKFFLVGGSALGAFRHQGFIPWDDDIDVAMFRDDFEKMEAFMSGNNNKLHILELFSILHLIIYFLQSLIITFHTLSGIIFNKILEISRANLPLFFTGK